MIVNQLLHQTAGNDLLFHSDAAIGFTKGDNYVTVQAQQYAKAMYVQLLFNDEKPNNVQQSKYTTSINLNCEDITPKAGESVNTAIAAFVVDKAIEHLTAFNPTAKFEKA